ncbi:MAG: hypothetical protein ACJAVV_003210, partial [Alphaproteobacteria bacterium]
MVIIGLCSVFFDKEVCGLILVLMFLSTCGGRSKRTPTVIVPTIPPLSRTLPTSGQCENVQHAVSMASDEGMFTAPFSPNQAIGDDTTPDSRWALAGLNKRLTLDLGSIKAIGALKLKWYKGSEVSFRFLVDTSADNTVFNQAIGTSDYSGRHSDFELINLTSEEARY